MYMVNEYRSLLHLQDTDCILLPESAMPDRHSCAMATGHDLLQLRRSGATSEMRTAAAGVRACAYASEMLDWMQAKASRRSA